MDIYKIFGAFGLILISIGIITKQRKKQDLYYIVGGILLEIYSIYIGDKIFIVLQLIFILSAIFDYFKKINKTNIQNN
ncbi:MAG: hypothetical protein A2725_01805 [Candidatus Magasanikbacteria bacterium RIFCSPHIGHO2_01_FULL_33_34]|uniref:Uncharacterized protein n=1 Tax=Candidatus Magasanikbacteria bacterium RIFCSPHIGHO2_01_FULL_33_34 TaxID=1798671 RepID=A0A1F6LKP2_9BACT|nr:MAG: hypothetical protein A2725_01805 [Candidatus Magasanikbacteria bacterium RIFCSPHIGHO2_01_FULL_33_34]OGH65707.1 MAG: hypothetical protein A3B83_02310 [Candidatus Magasanikbacteria bacterium RIFCSPHIGHO2_02_FULL_33_17]OGH76320.1 MAG: hypothetical protein A3A89_03135 [Candidatus Magasanikbacteria bacterium RIFCSPLOWO2_01_FULL_33_34]